MPRPSDYPVHTLPERAFLASDTSAAFGEHAPSHRIDFYAIVWFSETRGEHLIDFQRLPVKKNLVYLIGRNQVHSIPAARLPAARTIVFSAAMFDRIGEPALRQLFLPFRNEGIAIPASMQAAMISLFDLILLEDRGAADEPLLLKYIGAFLTLLFRFSNCSGLLTGGADPRVATLYQLVLQHFREERSAQFYARRVGLTTKRMNEILRPVIGTTLNKLISRLLIIEAKRELFHQRLSIKEIAYGLGFSDQSYFARFFRKHTGATPEAFRSASLRHAGSAVLMFK